TLTKDPDEIRMYKMIIMMDPPEHDRLRALVSRVFTPRRGAGMEPMIRGGVVGDADQLDGAQSVDAGARFPPLFPTETTPRVLGVPKADRQGIRHRLDLSLHREPGELEPTPEGVQAIMETGIYLFELAAEKRKNPGDDMISRLTQVTVDRGDGVETGLDDEEI